VDGLLAQAEYDDDQRGGNGCKQCKYSGHIFPRVLQMAKCCFFFQLEVFNRSGSSQISLQVLS
jgi:hypothetical protein